MPSEPVPGETELTRHLLSEEGCLPTGIVVGVMYITPYGESGYTYYTNGDNMTFELVGLLENLKHQMLSGEWDRED